MMVAERREGIATKDFAHAVSDSDVVGRQNATHCQVGERGLILPHHVLEGVQTIVVEQVDCGEPAEKSWEYDPTVTHD
jgi:hypothetical protein